MWARRITCAAGSAPTFAKAVSRMRKPTRWCARQLMLTTLSSPTTKKRLALENHLIKQKQPRFNILLRDDKTYPYVKLTLGERFPRVYVTRRLRKDGSSYYGPYFPTSLAYRIVDLIHRHFLIPSCKVDLGHFHPRPCLQYYIGRCLGPCVQGLTTPEAYQEAVRDVKLFLEGRPTDLSHSLRERMAKAARG
jgi:excinuclease ABC subunit C